MENECKFCCNEPRKIIGYSVSSNQRWLMSLKKIDNNFVLAIEKIGSCKELGKKIRFCPFCGRNLNDEEGGQNE